MRKKIQIYDKSIEKAGICKDYKDAIAEYIWNSFDADATVVEIITKENEIGGLEYLEIADDGKGIYYETLDTTFGAFLVSNKVDNPKWSNIHGSEGKGRFSFIAFAHEAVWHTIYKKGNLKVKFRVTITSSDKDYIDFSEREYIDCNTKTGTRVIFNGISEIIPENINSLDFKKCLANIFAWFLYLNKDKGSRIVINGEVLDYKNIIDDEFSETKKIKIEEYEFTIHFIKWIGKIREKYFHYFLDSKHHEKYKKYTSFNKDSIEFPHSLYVLSDYFACHWDVSIDIFSDISILLILMVFLHKKTVIFSKLK